MERQLYNYTYISRPYAAVAEALKADARSVLAEATEAATNQADAIEATLEAKLGNFEVGRDVRIELDAWEPIGDRTIKVPLRWRAAEHPAIFPAMHGQVEVTALSINPPLTQVTFTGHYRPPLGVLGAIADALAGHRVAEASIHWFIDHIAAALVERVNHNATSLVD